MLGTTRFPGGLPPTSVDGSAGCVGRENLVELAVGDRCSTDECDEVDRIDWRGWG